MSGTLSDHFRSFTPIAPTVLIGAFAITSVAIAAFTSIALKEPQRKITPSPRSKVLKELSKAEQDELAYPLDAFPGARDVQSPVSIVDCAKRACCS
jgi:hypothetical protein